MSIMHDEKIDLERVVSDPEYRRHVIVYLNEQTPERPQAVTWPASPRMSFQRSAGPLLRKFG